MAVGRWRTLAVRQSKARFNVSSPQRARRYTTSPSKRRSGHAFGALAMTPSPYEVDGASVLLVWIQTA